MIKAGPSRIKVRPDSRGAIIERLRGRVQMAASADLELIRPRGFICHEAASGPLWSEPDASDGADEPQGVMTTPPSPPPAPSPVVAAPKGPVSRLIDRVLVLGPVAWLLPILDIYNAAGGGLLAAGLAFSSLFAILPAILLVIGVVGVVLGDAERLNALTTSLAAAFPPMADFFAVALASFASGGTTYSLIGLIFLAWGASRFYQSLDEAMARIFQSTKRRGVLQRNVLGIIWVVVLTVIVVGLILLSRLVGDDSEVASVARLAGPLGAAVISLVVFGTGLALVYRLVPTNRPDWRHVRRPALMVGAFLTVFTAVFALLAPTLVGSLKVYGAFVAVFAAMLWLSVLSQALLVGAAWTHHRVRQAAIVTPAQGPGRTH
jgi:membrane protein